MDIVCWECGEKQFFAPTRKALFIWETRGTWQVVPSAAQQIHAHTVRFPRVTDVRHPKYINYDEYDSRYIVPDTLLLQPRTKMSSEQAIWRFPRGRISFPVTPLSISYIFVCSCVRDRKLESTCMKMLAVVVCSFEFFIVFVLQACRNSNYKAWPKESCLSVEPPKCIMWYIEVWWKRGKIYILLRLYSQFCFHGVTSE